MPTINIGPCQCCGGQCCEDPPETLTMTITATGDCDCWPGTFTLPYVSAPPEQRWESTSANNSGGICGFTGGFIIICEGGAWSLIANYQSNVPNPFAGCILGEPDNTIEATCDPFYIEFTSGVESLFGAECCSGTVTVIITE